MVTLSERLWVQHTRHPVACMRHLSFHISRKVQLVSFDCCFTLIDERSDIENGGWLSMNWHYLRLYQRLILQIMVCDISVVLMASEKVSVEEQVCQNLMPIAVFQLPAMIWVYGRCGDLSSSFSQICRFYHCRFCLGSEFDYHDWGFVGWLVWSLFMFSCSCLMIRSY